MKCLDGTCSKNRIWRREIDQIIIVDDDGAKLKFFTAVAETLRVRFQYSGGAALPHSWAGGKNLECVGAESVGHIQRSRDIASDRGMNADTNAAVFPSGYFRRRWSFRAILVGGVESQYTPVLFFGHSLRLSRRLGANSSGIQSAEQISNYYGEMRSGGQTTTNSDSEILNQPGIGFEALLAEREVPPVR